MKMYYEIILLFTFLLQFTENSGEPNEPTFPSSFFLKIRHQPAIKFSSIWFDEEKKFLRMDYGDGSIKTIAKKETDGKITISTLIPIRHKEYCITGMTRYSGNLHIYLFDSLSKLFKTYFKYAGNELIQGVKLEKWYFEGSVPINITAYLRYKNSTIDPNKQVINSITAHIQVDNRTQSTAIFESIEQKLNIEDLEEPFKNIQCINETALDWERIRADVIETNFSVPEEVYKTLPDTFDWRTLGFEIHDDDNCKYESSWSCVIAATLEGAYFAQKNRTKSPFLSTQSLIDCAVSYSAELIEVQNEVPHVYEWIIQNGGIPEKTQYPGARTGLHETCKISNVKPAFPVKGFGRVPYAQKTQLKAALVHYGPISAQLSVDADAFSKIGDNIYAGVPCGEQSGLNAVYHVLIVGYGIQNGKEYFIINPFLGSDFGIGPNKYMKMSAEYNECSIHLYNEKFVIV